MISLFLDLINGSASHWENVHDELRPCQVIHVRGGGVEERMREFPNDHLCLFLNRKSQFYSKVLLTWYA